MTKIAPLGASVEARLAGADPRIFVFLQAWREARGDALIPKRSAFDPMAVRSLLPFLWIYRFETERDDYVVRLAGEEINNAWGRSIKGMTMREVVGDADYPVMRERWGNILGVPLIHYGASSERLSALDTRRAERMLTPLADNDGTPNHILGISLYEISPTDSSRPSLEPEDITQIPCSEV